ncbi:hypothetical protein D3C77_686160 [compost metagenome]
MQASCIGKFKWMTALRISKLLNLFFSRSWRIALIMAYVSAMNQDIFIFAYGRKKIVSCWR